VCETHGWRAGILICYDNNVVENVRATALLGADVLFAPHVTVCTPSPRPGAGFVEPSLWATRERDPTSLRAEFGGLKRRAWLTKWLLARAYDNGVYVVFSNPIIWGCGGGVPRVGGGVATAVCMREKLEKAGGYRYRAARGPELYGEIIGRANEGKETAEMR